jgi:hypothetical protein
MHGRITEDAVVELVDRDGAITRKASVIISKFEVKRVDMVLLQLVLGEPLFEDFIEICRTPVRVGQEIAIIGLVPNSADELTVFFEPCKVIVIDAGAIFQSNYVARDCFSGSAVIVSLENTGIRVVGVHVATQDDTVSPPPITYSTNKKHKAAYQALVKDVEDSNSSLANSLHGHMAFCLICDVARVPEILDAL